MRRPVAPQAAHSTTQGQTNLIKLQAIPTNVITGFLGVGKSTAILNLLRLKPKDERWAVLVNEFGEIGIDGSLIGGQDDESSGVYIREVPGGCMCCTSGIPMQIALTALLARAKPHRLLIEPTGLGHPREVLGTLSSAYYLDVIDLRSTITLVDARKIQEPRYTGHDTFNEQIMIADVIVANKADQYSEGDYQKLLEYLEKTSNSGKKSVLQIAHANLPLACLDGLGTRVQASHHHISTEPAPLPQNPVLPACGYLSVDNAGDGYFSRGWMFNPHWVFSHDKLHALFASLDIERIKAVFHTDQGLFAFNRIDATLTRSALNTCRNSRVEVITSEPSVLHNLEAALLDCVETKR